MLDFFSPSKSFFFLSKKVRKQTVRIRVKVKTLKIWKFRGVLSCNCLKSFSWARSKKTTSTESWKHNKVSIKIPLHKNSFVVFIFYILLKNKHNKCEDDLSSINREGLEWGNFEEFETTHICRPPTTNDLWTNPSIIIHW